MSAQLHLVFDFAQTIFATVGAIKCDNRDNHVSILLAADGKVVVVGSGIPIGLMIGAEQQTDLGPIAYLPQALQILVKSCKYCSIQDPPPALAAVW